jgi:hypothetical protein
MDHLRPDLQRHSDIRSPGRGRETSRVGEQCLR